MASAGPPGVNSASQRSVANSAPGATGMDGMPEKWSTACRRAARPWRVSRHTGTHFSWLSVASTWERR